MLRKNVWKNIKLPLEIHEDNRGIIADIFYQNNIDHVAAIKSKQGVRRGDHYHKKTTQHILVIEGSIIYVYQPVNKSQLVKYEIIKKGDMISTPPFEIHTLLFPENNEFIVFSSGLRGGKDYETDTFRVEPLILPTEIVNLVSKDDLLLRKEHIIRK